MKIKVTKTLVFFFDKVEGVNYTRTYFGRLTMKGAKKRLEENENPVNPVKVIYTKNVSLTYEVDDDVLGNFLDANAVICND